MILYNSYPFIVSYTTATATGTGAEGITIARPDGARRGDRLFVCLLRTPTTGTGGWDSDPLTSYGFSAATATQGGAFRNDSQTTGNDRVFAVVDKIVVGTEPASYFFTAPDTGASMNMVAIAFVVRNAALTGGGDTATVTSQGTNDFTPAVDTITPNTHRALVIKVLASSINNATSKTAGGAPPGSHNVWDTGGPYDGSTSVVWVQQTGTSFGAFLQVAAERVTDLATSTSGSWAGTADDATSEWSSVVLAIGVPQSINSSPASGQGGRSIPHSFHPAALLPVIIDVPNVTNVAATAASATGTANNASISVKPTATAGSGTTTANNAALSVKPTATAGSGTSTANNPGATVAPVVTAGSSTGAANTAAGSVQPVANLGTGTSTANTAAGSVQPSATAGSGTGAASDSAGSVKPTASAGSAAATANNPSASIQPSTATATASSASSDGAGSVAPGPDAATGAGTAIDAAAGTGTFAGAEAATGTASAGDAAPTVSFSSGAAAGTAEGGAATGSIAPTGDAATGTGTAYNATIGGDSVVPPPAEEQPRFGGGPINVGQMEQDRWEQELKELLREDEEILCLV